MRLWINGLGRKDLKEVRSMLGSGSCMCKGPEVGHAYHSSEMESVRRQVREVMGSQFRFHSKDLGI